MNEPPSQPADSLWEPCLVTLDCSHPDSVNLAVAAGADAPVGGVTFASYLSLVCGVLIDMTTGEVFIPETLNLTQAARAFWREISSAYPGLVPEVPEHERGFGQ